MLQSQLDFGNTYKVGCRAGAVVHHYVVENSYSHREAQQAVAFEVPGACPILAVIRGGKVDKPVTQEYSYTPSPGPVRA